MRCSGHIRVLLKLGIVGQGKKTKRESTQAVTALRAGEIKL